MGDRQLAISKMQITSSLSIAHCQLPIAAVAVVPQVFQDIQVIHRCRELAPALPYLFLQKFGRLRSRWIQIPKASGVQGT